MASSAPSHGPDPASGAARPPCVLLVEDSPEYALLVTHMLRDALGGEADVQHRERLGDAYGDLASGDLDCVLLDLSLPDSAGLASLAAVQDIAPDVPVVVLSGQEDEELAVRAVHEGAQDYLVKRNVDTDLLARSVRYAIQRKRGELALARQAFYDQLTGLPNRKLLLKIDRSFVTRLADGVRPKRLFASAVGVAHALSLRAVAEGVETREQFEQVAAFGCDAVQGFFVRRPAPAAEIGPTLGEVPGHTGGRTRAALGLAPDAAIPLSEPESSPVKPGPGAASESGRLT